MRVVLGLLLIYITHLPVVMFADNEIYIEQVGDGLEFNY